MAPCSFATIMLHNYIRREAHRDWLFKKYDDDEMIVIDEEEDMLVEFMASHLTSEMDLFRDSLSSLMHRALESLHLNFVLLYDGCALFSNFTMVVTYFVIFLTL